MNHFMLCLPPWRTLTFLHILIFLKGQWYSMLHFGKYINHAFHFLSLSMSFFSTHNICYLCYCFPISLITITAWSSSNLESNLCSQGTSNPKEELVSTAMKHHSVRRQCNDDDNDESYNESSMLGSVMCLCVDGCGCVVKKL